MATYDLRRFAHADSLKAIGVQHLLALLNPYKPYFDGRGLMLPSSLLRQVVLLVSVSMLLYTDGVTEAMNEKRELYDEVVPLKRFALENRERPSSKEFIDTLVSDVKRFSGSAPQADDITALYICRR